MSSEKSFIEKLNALKEKNSAERAKEYRKENWREFQRTKEERTKATREHRRYKQSLYLSGQLREE